MPHEVIWFAEMWGAGGVKWVKLLFTNVKSCVRTAAKTSPITVAVLQVSHRRHFVLEVNVVTSDLRRPMPSTLPYAYDEMVASECQTCSVRIMSECQEDAVPDQRRERNRLVNSERCRAGKNGCFQILNSATSGGRGALHEVDHPITIQSNNS